jgi:ATP-dependent DNA helicase Rep
MRERAQALLTKQGKGAEAGKVRIATFHALGLSILRSEAKAAGLRPGFSILDPGDLESIVAELVATADRGACARAAQWKISAWKNALVSPAAALSAAQNDEELGAARRTATTTRRSLRTGRSTSTT